MNLGLKGQRPLEGVRSCPCGVIRWEGQPVEAGRESRAARRLPHQHRVWEHSPGGAHPRVSLSGAFTGGLGGRGGRVGPGGHRGQAQAGHPSQQPALPPPWGT